MLAAPAVGAAFAYGVFVGFMPRPAGAPEAVVALVLMTLLSGAAGIAALTAAIICIRLRVPTTWIFAAEALLLVAAALGYSFWTSYPGGFR